MIKIALIAPVLLSISTASSEMKSPAQNAGKESFPMVRNIGIAEMGDAIVVRERKGDRAPLKKFDTEDSN
jgi:hypothetical protein